MNHEAQPSPKATVPGVRCRACERFSHPARAICPGCLGTDLEADTVSGAGTVYSSTVVRHGRKDRSLPYGITYVDLDAGPRVMASFAGENGPLVPDTRVQVGELGWTDAGLPMLEATPG